MKCSACSNRVLPVVAVDIDGTLAQYHRHFLDFACHYYDRDFFIGYDGSMELHEWMELELSEYRQCKLAYRQGGGKRSIPSYPGAIHFMHWLREQPVEIWITTTRPYLRLDSTDPDTRFWLERHGIEYDGLLYHEDKYRVLGETVDHERVIAIVDDLEQQLVSAVDYGYSPEVCLQPNRRHNEADQLWPDKFHTFSQLEDIINERICGWHAAHP